MVLRHNNQPIVVSSDRRDDREDAQPGWSVWGGAFFLFRGGKLNSKKITKIKYYKGLRWPPFEILSCNNQPKTRGHDGGGMGYAAQPCKDIGKHDGNNEPLAEGNGGKDNEYGKGGDISNDDNEYAVGVNGVSKPLDEGNNQRCPRTSMPCESAAKHALTLRASYFQWAALRV